MKTTTFFLAALSLFVPLLLVEAHGIIGSVTIDGKTYQGPIAGGQRIAGSPIRQITDASPIKGANNKANTCGPGAKLASFVAPANPGSTVSVLWTANDRKHWPHNTGPQITYLASCGSVSCDKFDASNARWFKINQVGKRNGGWVQQDQFNRKAHTFQLPSNLAPGGYLIRHEIIALHLANPNKSGGAEFYPGCIQIKVGGNKTGAPSSNELVRFPGAYSDNDAGIRVNPFSNAAYKFPGPAISKLASRTSSTGNDNESDETDNTDENNNNDASPSDTPVNVVTPKPSESVTPPTKGDNNTGSCNSSKSKKKRAQHDDDDTLTTPDNDFKPRHVSRVMRRIVDSHGH